LVLDCSSCSSGASVIDDIGLLHRKVILISSHFSFLQSPFGWADPGVTIGNKRWGYNDDITFIYSLIGKAVLKLPRYVKHDEKMYSEDKKNSPLWDFGG
jgi:hypothetical protein